MLKLLCATALLAGFAIIATTPAGAQRRCPGKFLTANRYWKITYQARDTDPTLYACDQRHRSRRPIVISGAEIVYPAAAVRGRLVALAEEFYDSQEGSQIYVVRPDNPRETFEQLRISAYGNVTDIVLRDRQRIAWIACRSKLPSDTPEGEPICPGAAVKRVFVHDGSAPTPKREGQIVQAQGRQVGSGRNIRSKSLSLRNGIISWRQGDRTFRYRLR